MTDENTGSSRVLSNATPLPDLSKIRKQAQKKAKEIPLPDLKAMTHDEILHMFQEMQVKQMEAGLQIDQLLEDLEETNSILNGISDGVWSLKWPDFEIVYVSPAIEDIYGRPLQDFYENPDLWQEATHPEDQHITRQAFEQLREEGLAIRRCRIVRPDGSIAWIADKIKLVFGQNRQPVRVEGICRDITDRKQAEKEKEKLQAQLAQAQKMESVGRLAGGIAHDFNNKLSIINGYAELTLDNLDPDEPAYENLKEIYNAGRRSANIVRQLLAFARQQTIRPVQLDLNETISHMLKMLQRLIGENIDLSWHPCKNLWKIKIDPSQIDQIMANLVVNARDAISDVGRLSIETKNVVVDEDYCRLYSYFVPGKYIMLSVSDNGCGMEKEVQNNLFVPFFTTKAIGKGTGLGLSTIYGIVKQNKGFINIYSEPGQGTTVKVFLPPHEEQDSGLSQHLKESANQIPVGSETVLLVEDEPAILQMGRGMLEKLGYTVLTAEKPDEALQHSKEYGGNIHLLITDVVMPEMNGRDLSAKLSVSSPGLKTIYMSGYTADVIGDHGVLDEGLHFIQKPFSLRDLTIKVRETIDQK